MGMPVMHVPRQCWRCCWNWVRTLAHRHLLLVGVFQNAPLHVMQEAIAHVGLDPMQLHGAEPVEWAHFRGMPVVCAFHVSAGAGAGTGDTNRVVERTGVGGCRRKGLWLRGRTRHAYERGDSDVACGWRGQIQCGRHR